MDHTLAEPLDLYDETKCKYINMNDPIVCGWGATPRDDFGTNNILNAEYSDNLYCIPVIIHSRYTCNKAIPPGDYKESLLCGQPGYPKQKITLVINFYNFFIFVQGDSFSMVGLFRNFQESILNFRFFLWEFDLF